MVGHQRLKGLMVGWQATRAIRAMGLTSLPVIALSAEASHVDDEVKSHQIAFFQFP